MINIERIYNKILSELKIGHRGIQVFSEDELKTINSFLKNAKNEDLNKVLCVICHSRLESTVFEQSLIERLGQKELPPHLLIYTLEAFRKHVVNVYQKKGNRLGFNHLKVLDELINHDSYEVLEWTIRTIDSLGSQAVYFRSHLVEIYPKGIIINKQKRMIRKLISYMEQKWGRYEQQFN